MLGVNDYRPAHRGSNFRRVAIIVAGVAVIVAVWLAVWIGLQREREHALLQAESDTANAAAIYEEHLGRAFLALDMALLHLKSEYERAPGQFSLASMMNGSSLLRRLAVQISLIGPDGVLRDSSSPGFVPVDLSDREHVAVQMQSSGVGLFISRPVMGRVSGKWTIQLTRRLETRAGDFAGVMVLSLDPNALVRFSGAADLGPSGLMMLIGQDGIIRATVTGYEVTGEVLPDPGLAPRLIAAGSQTQHFIDPLDGEPRIISTRPVGDLPLLVWVSRAESDIMAVQRPILLAYVLVGMGVSLLLAGALVLLYGIVCRAVRDELPDTVTLHGVANRGGFSV